MKAKTVWLVLGGLSLGIVTVSAMQLGPDFFEMDSAAKSLESELERAKKVGNPLQASDFVPSKPPNSQNATIEFEQSRKLASVLKLNQRLEAFQKAILGDDIVAAKQLSQELQPMVDLAEKVASKPILLSDRNVDSINDLGYAFMAHGKDLVRLLCLEAQLEYHGGKFEDGNKKLKAALAIGSLISQDRLYITLLIESSCRAMVFATLGKLAIVNRSRADVLETLDRALPPTAALNLYEALRGEAYFGTVQLRNLDRLGGWKKFADALESSDTLEDLDNDPYQELIDSADPKTFRKEGIPPESSERAFLARHLAFWNDVLEKTKHSYDPVELTAWMENKREELDRQTGPSYRLVKLLARTFSAIGEAGASAQAMEGSKRGLIKVLLYKARFGQYPDTLSNAGFNELDPYTKEPYRLLIKEDVVKVYSVGPNLRDDQGVKELQMDDTGNAPDDVSGDTDRKNGYPIV